MQIWPTTCPHQHGRLKRCHTKWSIGWIQGRRLGPSWVRGMWILKVPHYCNPISSNSWVGRNPPQWALRWGGLLLMLTLPLPLSMPKDLETSSLHASDRREWWVRHVQMPSWWGELTNIPGHKDHQEFTQKVYASFAVSKACNWAKGVGIYYVQPPTHPSIWKYWFIPLRDVRFGSQDICLCQLHHTLAYARAFQHWAEKVKPPVSGQPCCLVGCHSQWSPHNWSTQGVAPAAAEPTQGDPCLWPTVETDLCLQPYEVPQRQKYQLLHPESLCYSSPHPTTSSHALCLGLWRLHRPFGGKNPWKAAHHGLSPAFCLRKS